MIVITSLSEWVKHVLPGETFRLTVKDMLGCEVIIEEEITVSKKIDFIASYRFCLEDGTCPGFHLCGIFGNKAELPKEMIRAVRIEDLTKEQHENLVKSVGVKVRKRLTFKPPLTAFCPSA